MSATAKFIPGSPERPRFYENLRKVVAVVTQFFYGLDVQGLENIPTSGPVMLVSNHLSFWDIPSGAVRPRRMLHYMAKSEYAKNGFMRWLFTNLEAFFVNRGEGDIEAIRNALNVLKAGQVLFIFPEGHRSDDHALIAAHDGFALIAFKAGVPIIPVGTWGSEFVGKGGRFAFWRPTIHVRYGKPIHLVASGKKYSRDDLVNATNQIMGNVAALLPPAYRGIYAEAALPFLSGTTAEALPASTEEEARA